ncbi:uncharacterized protein CEXT_101441 [Caerostris extrusa]|uniref:Uncharacterized protein n=1 Tax=Caerostris extrusa TaxID=172846 RepID=A0AAV4M472_CAEEX|nr:uncharacterized protein CEXT_101441 [Caerostris extrusa]
MSSAREKSIHQCFPGRGDVDEIPGNAEELRQLCSYLRNTVSCLESLKEDCFFDNYDQKGMDLLDNFVRSVCQEGSRLHTEISDNIHCLKEVIRNDGEFCGSVVRNSMSALKDHLEGKKSSRKIVEFYTLKDCLYTALKANCFLSQVSNTCGNEAKDAALEVLERTGFLRDDCPASLHVEIEEMLEILVTEMQEDIYVNDVLNLLFSGFFNYVLFL